jgi:hypothetical protein
VKQYDNTNSGILTKNEDKEAEQQPDYRGSLNVGGCDYWLSGWIKVGKEGGKLANKQFLSLSISPKDGLPREKSVTGKKVANSDVTPFLDDTVPF